MNKQQRQQLHDALIDAFPDRSSLKQMLWLELEKNLDEITLGNSLRTIVFELIRKAEADNFLPQLIFAARQSNPGNFSLQIIAKELLPNYYTQIKKSVETKIFEEHIYANLATIEIKLYEAVPPQKLRVDLSISFGTPEVRIPKLCPNHSGESIDIKFGIKNGELCFNLRNGRMPLSERKSLVSQYNIWRGTPIGKPEAPKWEFGLQNESRILHDCLINEVLGILELLDANICCELEAVFQINHVNRNNIKIISLDDGTNKKQKDTQIALLLKDKLYPTREIKTKNYFCSPAEV
ncbi:effector-associated domain EAD1-containing protein [Scytonema sp. NUACC26]|uniref:effector-associated domain EAD1-containing protein n=1 Tax=Scytonema sp. NUACC26 TaxID=3140176 RepID=UPI0034DBD303